MVPILRSLPFGTDLREINKTMRVSDLIIKASKYLRGSIKGQPKMGIVGGYGLLTFYFISYFIEKANFSLRLGEFTQVRQWLGQCSSEGSPGQIDP